MTMQCLTLDAVVQTTSIQSHLPTKENQYEKSGLGFGGFVQCANEYLPSEYFHMKLQSYMMYGHTFRL